MTLPRHYPRPATTRSASACRSPCRPSHPSACEVVAHPLATMATFLKSPPYVTDAVGHSHPGSNSAPARALTSLLRSPGLARIAVRHGEGFQRVCGRRRATWRCRRPNSLPPNCRPCSSFLTTRSESTCRPGGRR
jgi:hypothetical protein